MIHLIASEQADTACTEQEVKERRRAMAMVHCSSPVKEFRFDCVSWPWPITAIHNKSPKMYKHVAQEVQPLILDI